MKNKASAVIVAGGSSTRMCGIDKQFEKICGIPVIIRSILAFEACDSVFEIIIAVKKENIKKLKGLIKEYGVNKVKCVVEGGDTRSKSVAKAFEAVSDSAEIVAVHDGARPLVKPERIEEVIANAQAYGASVLAVPVKDTIKVCKDGFIFDTPDRSRLYIAQTPQVFKKSVYKKALEISTDENITDDCMLVEKSGVKIHITKGDYTNIKITTPEDLGVAESFLGGKMMRVGSGYDVHKFAADRKLILGGEEIPFEMGLLGHSDADVLVHAVMDSLLGAAALGDIGKHFPDTDEKYKNADSIKLLKHVAGLLYERGYSIGNIDATVVAQKPKLAPFIPKMRENIAAACKIDLDKVNVKTTTEEGLGFTGEMLGISASCVSLIC
ncbi:MAG: 2-C-methyl-D-erythritol 2,4-cyclodiphosphate synthase [Oscillospiraceae bacterium]